MYNTFSLSDVCCQSRSGIDPATTKPVGQNGRAVRRAASDIPNTALRWSWVSKSKVQGGVAVFFGSGNKFIHQPLGKILEIFEGSKTPFFFTTWWKHRHPELLFSSHGSMPRPPTMHKPRGVLNFHASFLWRSKERRFGFGMMNINMKKQLKSPRVRSRGAGGAVLCTLSYSEIRCILIGNIRFTEICWKAFWGSISEVSCFR